MSCIVILESNGQVFVVTFKSLEVGLIFFWFLVEPLCLNCKSCVTRD